MHLSYNERFSSKNINIFLNDNLIKEDDASNNKEKEQILFTRKSSIEVLFNLIKSFQNDYFSKRKEINKIKYSKKMITSLMNDLSLMKTEKEKQFDYLKIKNENNKKRIQDILFSENQTKKVNNIEINDILHFSYVNKKKELKLINFQIENEIQKTKFIIEQKNQMYLYLKAIPFILDTNQEKFCNINYENLENISGILKDYRTSIKNKFISIVKDKIQIESEINALKEKIKNTNLNSNNKKYVETEEIIYEETKENNKTLITNQSKRNSYASLNKLNNNKKVLNNSSKNVIKKHLSIDALMKDSIYRNIFPLYQKNQINNFLNMNINVNINVNNGVFYKNKNNLSSSLDEGNDYNSEDFEEQYEIDLDDNGINDSPIQTKENINENEFNKNNKRNSNNYKLEINNKEMMKIYNKSCDYVNAGIEKKL